MATKDFGSIESDYEFFMAYATEAESDGAMYDRELSGFAEGRSTIRMLDFGCGAGDFSHRLMSALNWPPQAVQMTLVEPVQHQREVAAQRLAAFSRYPIESFGKLPDGSKPRYELILSNHALYYVDELAATLEQMHKLLAPSGKLLLAIAGWDNVLLQFWKMGFALMGRQVPYYAAEDVHEALSRCGIPFRTVQASYRLQFPDTAENRQKILRFLFGDYLQEIPSQRLLNEFDRYVNGDEIAIQTHCEHFAVEV